MHPSTPSSSSSSSSSHIPLSRRHSHGGTAPLDPATQRQDIRIFERNIAKSANSLRQFRRRYLCVVALLIALSAYWTWRLRAKLTDAAPKLPQETHRLVFAWALLGFAPIAAFFALMYQSTVVMPSRFIDRLNRSLVDFNVAYCPETGRLLRTSRPEIETNLREPVYLRAPPRGKPRPTDN